MRLSYSPCAQFFLFFVQWSDCHLAGALGLLRILIYKVSMSFGICMHMYVGVYMPLIGNISKFDNYIEN